MGRERAVVVRGWEIVSWGLAEGHGSENAAAGCRDSRTPRWVRRNHTLVTLRG